MKDDQLGWEEHEVGPIGGGEINQQETMQDLLGQTEDFCF